MLQIDSQSATQVDPRHTYGMFRFGSVYIVMTKAVRQAPRYNTVRTQEDTSSDRTYVQKMLPFFLKKWNRSSLMSYATAAVEGNQSC